MRRDWDHLSDEEFDDRIKSSAFSHQEPLWEGAWEAMESKLEEKKERKIIPFWWRSAAAILIFGLIGGYFYLKADSESELAGKTGVLKNNLSKLERDRNSNNSKEEFLENKTINKAVSDKQKSNERTFAKNLNPESQHNQLEPSQKNKFTEILPKEHNASIIIDQVLDKNQMAFEKEKVLTESDSMIVQKSTTGQVTSINTDSEVITVVVNTNDSDSLVTVSDEQFAENQKSKKKSKFSRWAFNLGASPDYSSVSFGQSEPIGYNFQVGLAFNITEKLQVKTALIRSLKLYEAYADDYAWPTKWGTPTSPLVDVGASCNMLDIPVSLTYFFARKNKNAYYTSFGVTNYYMIKEKYEYHYLNDEDPNLKWKNWEGSTGFAANSVANVSIGLQRKITNKITVQFEPFVKIPLRSIGFGNVKLYSAGLFLNVIPTNIFRNRNQN